MHSDSSASYWRSLTSGERARFRKLQLEGIEREQLLEEKEALKMTEEERETLLSSFRSVKTEFCDLDGLSWSEYSFNDGLAGQGSGYGLRNSPAPTDITNSPIIGQRHLIQQSPTASKARINKSKPKAQAASENRDIETNLHFEADSHSKYHQVQMRWSKTQRPENQDQNHSPGPVDDTASAASGCMSSDDVIRASYYVPLATSPNATLSQPHAEYVADTPLFRCSSSGSLGTIGSPSIMGLDAHFGSVSHNGQTTPRTVGLGLPEFWDAAVKSKGSYPELSKSFDVDVTPSISHDSPLVQKSGLPRSPLSQWASSPSSQGLKSSVLAPSDEPKVASHTALGLALTFPRADTSQTADTGAVSQSPASRWLALYYGPRLYSAQALGIDLPITTSSNGDPSGSERRWDSNFVHLSQALDTPSSANYGLTSVSPGWSARPRSSSSPQWSGCPQSSHPPRPQTSDVREGSAAASPLQSFEEIHQSTSSYILESYSIAAHLHVEA